MTDELLDITHTPAHFTHFAHCAGNECPASRMAATPRHTQAVIQIEKPSLLLDSRVVACEDVVYRGLTGFMGFWPLLVIV